MYVGVRSAILEVPVPLGHFRTRNLPKTFIFGGELATKVGRDAMSALNGTMTEHQLERLAPTTRSHQNSLSISHAFSSNAYYMNSNMATTTNPVHVEAWSTMVGH